MQKKYILIFILLLTFSPLAAQGICEGPLVPCGRDINENGIVDITENCTFCHIFKLLDNILRYIMTCIVPIVAVLMLVVGGLMMVVFGVNPQKLAQSQKVIWGAILGLVVIFGSWVTLNTFMEYMDIAEWTGWQEGWWEVDCPIPRFWTIDQGEYTITTFKPVIGTPQNVDTFYNYSDRYGSSYGSGEEVVPMNANESMLFLHTNTSTDEVSLVMVHDMPNDGSGGDVSALIKGVSGAVLAVGDEPGEGYYKNKDKTGGQYSVGDVVDDEVYADWHWLPCCTDGIALSGINWDAGCITVELYPQNGIDSWTFVVFDLEDQQQKRVSLDMSKPLRLCSASQYKQ